jgi:surfactin synthase thioesterase subunit
VLRDEDVHRRGDAELVAEVERLSGTPSELLRDEEARRVYLPVIRNDYRAIETHPASRDRILRCPITAFVGDRDPRVTLDDARAWERHTVTGFQLRVLSGGHFYLTERPAETVSALRDVLGAAPSPLRSEI